MIRKTRPQFRRPRRFDRNLIVIGAGAGGLVSAYIGATVKAKVTLVEEGEMGGDCLNTGCVPSKTLLRSANLLAEIRRARRFGIRAGETTLEYATLRDRIGRVIRQIAPHDSAERYRALGVEVLHGHATLRSPWEVVVSKPDGEQILSSRAIVIATGASPRIPDIPGIDAIGYRTSDTIWSMPDLPRRLLTLGGGPIGCELAQAFQRLGSQVTLVEAGERLLPREAPEVARLIEKRFRQEGIDLRLNQRAIAFEKGNGQKTLHCEATGKKRQKTEIGFDEVLIAIGRVPNTENLGLEALGIERRQGRIETNRHLQTRHPSIYAVGDVASPWQFTLAAAHDAWYAVVNALFSPVARISADYRVMPHAIFTDPEIARVGLNPADAAVQGITVETTRFEIDDLDRAIIDGATDGFVEVVTASGKDRILGVTIVGHHAAERISEFVLAMKQNIGLSRILATTHIYPTMAEANKYVAGEWKKAHAPQRLMKWMEYWHRWRRG